MNNIFEYNRAVKCIYVIIKKLDVKLDGYTVLTEVGSNYYIYSPIIPLLCGASKVLAYVKDSSHGKAEEIKFTCFQIATYLGLSDKLQIATNALPEKWLSEADIITNSGMLRPLNKEKISKFKKGAVLPLMFEAWELRHEDLDINACKDEGIKVAGTWENHPDIKVFDYTGLLAIKLLLNAGVEIYDSNIVVWSNDHFGDIASKALKSLGAKKVWVTTDTDYLYSLLLQVDAIYICDYSEERQYFGDDGIFDMRRMISINNTLTIVHLYGNINAGYCKKSGLKLFPDRDGKSRTMTETLGYVGLEPLLRLQVAGFKVAEHLIRNTDNSMVQLL